MRTLVLAALLCACAPRARAPRLAANTATETQHISIRMALPNEFGPDDDPAKWMSCEPNGDVHDDAYEPLVAFAREHLLSDLSEYTRADPVRPRRISAQRQDAIGPPGVDLAVNARTNIGEIRLTLLRDDWRAGVNYCVHVLGHGPSVTLVVDRYADWSTPRTWSQ